MTFARSLLASAFVLALAAGPAGATAPDSSTLQAGTYAAEPEHAQVLFSIDHLGFSTFAGAFGGATGTLHFDPGSVASSKVSVTVPIDGLVTTSTALNGHLRGEKWFDMAKYPTASFTSTKVEVTGSGVGTITGDLTLHGVTKPVTLNASFHGAGPNMADHKFAVGFDATTTINRSDFGMTTYVPFISDAVKLNISIAFEK